MPFILQVIHFMSHSLGKGKILVCMRLDVLWYRLVCLMLLELNTILDTFKLILILYIGAPS